MLQTSKQKPRKLKDTLGVTPCQAPCGFKQLLFPLSPLATLVLCPHPALVLWRAGGGVCVPGVRAASYSLGSKIDEPDGSSGLIHTALRHPHPSSLLALRLPSLASMVNTCI